MPTIQEEIEAAFKGDTISKLVVENGAFTDVSRDLGLDMLKHQQEKKLQALTDPTKYNQEKAAEYDTLAQQVRAAFTASYDKYIAAGFPADKAKDEAMKVARTTKESNMAAIEKVYGSETSEVAMSKLAQAQTAKYGTAVKF